MDVRLGSPDDTQTFRVGSGKILINAASGVENDSFPTTLAANHVRGMGQGLVIEILKQHERAPNWRVFA
jgi:hypothetical protein